MKKLFVAAVSAVALVAGCAHHDSGQSQSRSAGTVVDDATLTAKVKTAIAKDVGAGTAANVNVNSYRGVVQLNGFVDSQEKIDRAAHAARGVEGVRSVENNLRVRPSS